MTSEVQPIADRSPSDLQEACRVAVTSVYAAIDAGHATAGIVHYADDAVLESAKGAGVGLAAIGEMLASREANTARTTRHVLADICVDVAEDNDEPRLTATLTIYVLSGPTPTEPEAVSDLEVRFVGGTNAPLIKHQKSTRRSAPTG